MASLREVAKDLLLEASDAIAFLVIWKTGRSWNGESYFEIEYEESTGTYHVDEDVIQELENIAKEDPDAIAVCGYYDNIGWSEDGISIDRLMDGIKFQREVAPGSLKKILESVQQPVSEKEGKTTFEYFKARYDKNRNYMIKCINKSIPVDSYHFVEVATQFCFGGTTEVDAWYNIKGVNDTQEMFEKKYLKKWDDSSWEARHMGTSRHIALTKRGLKAFYKAMF